MTLEAVFGGSPSQILNRIFGWHFFALGLSGWVTLYSSAVVNFQKGFAEMTGHTQGVCFAIAMMLSGAEVRKRKQERDRQQKLRDALQWTNTMPESRFEERLSAHFHEREYRLENISATERGMGFCLRVVRDGRTTLVHNAYWNASSLDEEKLAKLAETGILKLAAADRVLLLTKAEVSEATCKRMSLSSWNVVSGMDFANMTREFPVSTAAPTSSP